MKSKDIIRKAMRWGWSAEGVKRGYYDDDHAVIMGMTREECRFLRQSQGQNTRPETHVDLHDDFDFMTRSSQAWFIRK